MMAIHLTHFWLSQSYVEAFFRGYCYYHCPGLALGQHLWCELYKDVDLSCPPGIVAIVMFLTYRPFQFACEHILWHKETGTDQAHLP